MKMLKIVSIGLVLLVTVIGCNKNNSITPSEDQPGRRDYVWTWDTLGTLMTDLWSIWGTNPNDVWAVGHGGTETNRLWHYDGNKWSAYNKESITLYGNTIFGFASNDIWMGGATPDIGGPGAGIWHYNGITWISNFIYHVKNSTDIEVMSIWGNSPNNAYACGYITEKSDSTYGFILHYDGITWKEVVKVNYNSQFLNIRGEISNNILNSLLNNNVYVFDYRPNKISGNSDTVAFDEFTGNEFKGIYANSRGIINWCELEFIGTQLYFFIDRDAYLYENGNFVKQFTLDVNSSNFNYAFGRSENDLFISMNDGWKHYNGEDTQYIINFSEYLKLSTKALIFKQEVFCGFYDLTNGKSLVLHGKLK